MTNSIRDYLYLDIDRVRSIYAQATGGLTESIRELQEEIDTHSNDHQAKNESLSKSIMLGSGRIATRVLHDYLFTAMEKELGDKIVEVSKQIICDVAPGTLFRVSGRAEVDDVARMQIIMENYNDMYKYLLAISQASEIQETVWDLQDELQTANSNRKGNRRSKKDVETLLKQLEPEEISSTILREGRAGISPLITETFRRVNGLFYDDIFEVKIIPDFDDVSVLRGIINKEFLREDPTIIYAKYGSRPSVNWTMVGQVTTLLEPKITDTETGNGENAESVEDEQDKGLRDVLEGVYDPIAVLEELLMRSSIRTTWIATPLAIYHEAN